MSHTEHLVPNQEQDKIYMLYLASLRARKPFFVLPELYRVVPKAPKIYTGRSVGHIPRHTSYYLSCRLVSTQPLRKRSFIAEFQPWRSPCAVSRNTFCWRLITRRGFRLTWRFSLGSPRPTTETRGRNFKLTFECPVKSGFGLIADFRCDLCH
jgi:hypothetical protein